MAEYKRPHHQLVLRLLRSLNLALLDQTACCFGGGTAIVLLLDEYRESVDVDFLCASHEGWRTLRNVVNERSLGALLCDPGITLARGVRADRYGIRTYCLVEGTPVKLEIVREDRITLQADHTTTLPVPTLSRADMYAEKLLANTDRWADRATLSRDAIDLAMMVHHWGPIPGEAWAKVHGAYGASADRAFQSASQLLSDPAYLGACLSKMAMPPSLASTITHALGIDHNSATP